MNGLEAIINQITGDAQKEADEHLTAVRLEAEALLEKEKNEAAALAKSILDEGEKKAQNIRERASSAAHLDKRNRTLLMKQEIIGHTIEEVCEELQNAPDVPYFQFLYSLVSRFAPEGESEMHLNQQDLSRLPSDFEKKLKEAAPLSIIALSKTPANIESGFLLTYGGIDVNCTFKAVFEEAGDTLRDAVGKILFQNN